MSWLIDLVIVVLCLAAPWFVSDSRDGADWKPVSSTRDAQHVRPWSRSPALVAMRHLAQWPAQHAAVRDRGAAHRHCDKGEVVNPSTP